MKSTLLLFLLLGVLPKMIIAQNEPDISETRIYKVIDGHELYVDIFYTSDTQKKNNNPAIAFFHGGGWVFGSPSEFHGACKRYAAKGFVTFSFQYRLSVKEDGSYPHPDITLIECVKDARSAIRWLRAHCEELKINPEQIVVGGQSGGGQMTLGTALFDDINEVTDNMSVSSRPDAILLYSSCYNTLEPWIDMIMDDQRAQIWSVSPHHNIKKDMPPTLAFHGETDCTVLHYSVEFFKWKMEELGNSFELITLDGRDHYLGEGNEEYSRLFDEGIMERTDEFLIEHGFMP